MGIEKQVVTARLTIEHRLLLEGIVQGLPADISTSEAVDFAFKILHMASYVGQIDLTPTGLQRLHCAYRNACNVVLPPSLLQVGPKPVPGPRKADPNGEKRKAKSA